MYVNLEEERRFKRETGEAGWRGSDLLVDRSEVTRNKTVGKGMKLIEVLPYRLEKQLKSKKRIRTGYFPDRSDIISQPDMPTRLGGSS